MYQDDYNKKVYYFSGKQRKSNFLPTNKKSSNETIEVGYIYKGEKYKKEKAKKVIKKVACISAAIVLAGRGYYIGN